MTVIFKYRFKWAYVAKSFFILIELIVFEFLWSRLVAFDFDEWGEEICEDECF